MPPPAIASLSLVIVVIDSQYSEANEATALPREHQGRIEALSRDGAGLLKQKNHVVSQINL